LKGLLISEQTLWAGAMPDRLIYADGFVRYQHFGEGACEENEEKIQKLLPDRDETVS
jgi:hypothetical protein